MRQKFVSFSLYRSPSQNSDEFEKFLEKLELSIDKNPYTMVVLGDINAKFNSWYANDNTNIGESKIDILTAS